MANIVTVSCPRCGAPVAISCDYYGGGTTASVNCRHCGHRVGVHYENDSFGFVVRDVF